jgi:hypothetical protein
MPGAGSGGFQPASGFGLDRTYQDGIFIRSQFMNELKIAERENQLKILDMFGEKLPRGSKKGTRFMIPTLSNPAVGDVTDTITTGSFGYPDYVATDAPSITNTNPFSRKIAAGTAVVGIPLPLQNINEGQIELQVDQYRGCAMLFTKRFLDTALPWISDPNKAYGAKIKYALMNDIEEYAWLTWLYTGAITTTAGDYGTGTAAFTDAIGITNRTNYALTRTLTSINGASNLITPTTTGSLSGMSNSGNARFDQQQVPRLFGSATSDLTFDTINRLNIHFNQRNVPVNGRGILCAPKSYSDIAYLPQVSHRDYGAQNENVYRNADISARVLNFAVAQTNTIQAAGSSSAIEYNIAGVKGGGQGESSLLYDIQQEPSNLIIDNRLDKAEQCLIVMATTRYGAVVQRPDHAAVLQARVLS